LLRFPAEYSFCKDLKLTAKILYVPVEVRSLRDDHIPKPLHKVEEGLSAE